MLINSTRYMTLKLFMLNADARCATSMTRLLNPDAQKSYRCVNEEELELPSPAASTTLNDVTCSRGIL